jgi:hypothetical protein
MFAVVRSILVVSLLVATVSANSDSTHPEHSVRHGINDKRYGARGLHGDIHLTGFQGQPYTVPTQSGSIYNLISMPSMYVNARMQDMTTAQHCEALATASSLPERDARECLSYPGTYMTQVGIVSGDDNIVVNAAPRGDAITVTINGAVYEWSQLTIAVANATVELNKNKQILTVLTSELRITIRNVDRYVSVSVDVLNAAYLQQGRREMIKRNVNSRYANDVAASELPTIMHGLLGQSINYVIYQGGAVYAGVAADYQVKSITSHQFKYSLYAPGQDVASIAYP